MACSTSSTVSDHWSSNVNVNRNPSCKTSHSPITCQSSVLVYHSSVWHLGCGRISVPIQVEVLLHRPWSILRGACMGHRIHCIYLLSVVLVSQIVAASSSCSRASFQNFLDVFPTNVQVSHAMPTSLHWTSAALVLCSQTCLGIHPPLSIHHMLVDLRHGFLCNVLI